MSNDGRSRSDVHHRRRLGALSSALSMLLGFSLAVSPVEAGPRARADVIEIDLGVLPRGAQAEAEFVLRNDGDEVLRVLQAKPG